jgi:hypothetical protein
MPRNEQRRPARGGAADVLLGGEHSQHTKIGRIREAQDPARSLIPRLELASAAGGPGTVDGRDGIRLRWVPGGYSAEWRP